MKIWTAYLIMCFLGGLNIGLALRESWDHGSLPLIAFSTAIGVYILIKAGRISKEVW